MSAPAPAALVITGPSSSGKGTVAKLLAERLGWRSWCLDDYWISGAPKNFATGLDGQPTRVFDAPELYDGAKLAAEALAAQSQNAGTPFIIEGFVALHYPEIRALARWHIHLHAPWEIIRSRRMSREPRPSDVSWFNLGPAHSERLMQPQREAPGTIVMDATRPPAEIAEEIFALISRARANSSS